MPWRVHPSTQRSEANKMDKTGSVLVVGGGIAGIQAALDLADSGFKVYMVEREPSIGGVMTQLDKTFPTNDCAMCILAPKLVGAGRHPNIQLLTYSEVKSLEGEEGNFTATILKKARRVDPTKCKGCGDCLLASTGGVCPIARCAKSLLNGPCGGSHDGRCELGGEFVDTDHGGRF